MKYTMINTDNAKWMNVELPKGNSTYNFKIFLEHGKYVYETSECYNLTHFEVYCTDEQAEIINEYLAEYC